MNPADLRQIVNAEPFKPFVMYYPSGRTFRIDSRDQVLFSTNGQSLVVASDSPEGSFDHLDTIMIERVQTLPDDPKPRQWWVSTNGRH